MTANNNLELTGNLGRNPFAELIVEISQLKFPGSLRVSKESHKNIIYFDKGKIVFAVSNVRKHRLFEILLTQKLITQEKLTQIENFTNDFYLAQSLVKEKLITKENVDTCFSYQIGQIIKDCTYWTNGNWIFSSLARIKQNIRFEVEIESVLYEYAQTLKPESIMSRFKSFDEIFSLDRTKELTKKSFTPQEAYIISRLSHDKLSIDSLKKMCHMSNGVLLHSLYSLWLGGFISRERWNSAFSYQEISKINSTKYKLKTSAISVEEELEEAEQEKVLKLEEQARQEEIENKAKEREATKEVHKQSSGQFNLTLEEYLKRIEDAATHYEIFDIEPNAKLAEIKNKYFSMAKKFHPDLYHKTVEPTQHKAIQNAFTQLAQAYETLKDEEAREIYDFKLRKVLDQYKQTNLSGAEATKADVLSQGQSIQAAENFNTGYDHLMDENYFEALPFFGRAVQLENENARYHAFYGKALSFDHSKRHQAEIELQTAIKLDSENTIYRIMLAELFIEIGLIARAKGELNRLLDIFPGNKEAISLLDSLD
jgi:DnaJ-domain-containing protein 1